ncbi:MAG TPA: winged helix-turn-helix transcriptional regulator [Solirubrobacteraceae bacterium]|nr:winged helix-turn-helix transcriptional regulator [Solirubrobacteraceae bacterium]
MPGFLDEKRREIGARLKELRPLVDEYTRLEAAAAALDGVATPAASAPARSRESLHAPAAKATPRRRGAAKAKGRGRPKGSGTRAREALNLVKANPGITIPEIAERMGIKQNYLYRVLPGLAADGLVTKDGRGWRPNATA